MKIVLDNIKLSDQRAGGISAYWCELLTRIVRDKLNYSVIEHNFALTNNLFRSRITVPPENIIKDKNIPIKLLRYIPVFNKFAKNTIFHSSYYRYGTQPGLLNIVTVYDFIYEHYRHGIPRIVHHAQKKCAIQHAAGIICISNHTKYDLLRHFPNLDESIIKVIHLGISSDYKVFEDTPLIPTELQEFVNKKYVLFVGDREGYKNFKIAVDVIEQLKDLTLIFVGGPTMTENERIMLNKKLPNRFHHLTGIDCKLLNVLYNFAFCLLYPSSYEGFGIPVAEAMKAGCPVVASCTSSIPEVGGDAVLMVDTITSDNFISKLKLLDDSVVRRDMIIRGLQRVDRFNWETTYNETLSFYEQIYMKAHS